MSLWQKQRMRRMREILLSFCFTFWRLCTCDFTQTRPAAESFTVVTFERCARVLHADIVNKCLCCGEGSTVERNSDGKKATEVRKQSVEQRAGQEGQGSEWELASLPSSLVRSTMGLLGGPSPICVNASTCSEYTVYFWRPPSNTDVLPSPSATWVTGGTSESCSLYITCRETQTRHINSWINSQNTLFDASQPLLSGAVGGLGQSQALRSCERSSVVTLMGFYF